MLARSNLTHPDRRTRMNLVARVKGLLMTPRQEWAVIDGEALNTGQLLTGYVLPLAAIGPLAAAIGWSAFGMGGLFRMSFGYAISYAITMFILSVIGVFVCAWVVKALAPTFGATPDMQQAIKVAAYSPTAAWVAGIVNLPGTGIRRDHRRALFPVPALRGPADAYEERAGQGHELHNRRDHRDDRRVHRRRLGGAGRRVLTDQ
jgi:hypothetical protein